MDWAELAYKLMSEGQIPCHETAVAINRLEHPAGAVLALSGARFGAVSFRVAAIVALSTYRNHCGGSVRFNSCLAVFAGTIAWLARRIASRTHSVPDLFSRKALQSL